MTLAGNMQKHVLRQVLGFRAVSENPSGDPLHKTEMPAKEESECFPVGLGNARKKKLIGNLLGS